MNKDLKYNLFDSTECISEETMYNYIDKKLNSKEEHLVEKHLLDCDLCADALEGLQTVKNRKKIQFINSKIDKKLNVDKKQTRIVLFNYRTITAIAASLVLLIGTVFFFKFFTSKKMESADMAILTTTASEEKLDELNEAPSTAGALDSNTGTSGKKIEQKENEKSLSDIVIDSRLNTAQEQPNVSQNNRKDITTSYFTNTVKSGEVAEGDGIAADEYKSVIAEEKTIGGLVQKMEGDKNSEKLNDLESQTITKNTNNSQQPIFGNTNGTTAPNVSNSGSSPVDETVLLAKESAKKNSKDQKYRNKENESKADKAKKNTDDKQPESGAYSRAENKPKTEAQKNEAYFSSDLDNSGNTDSALVYDLPEKIAEFPGGNDSLMKFIARNFKYSSINKDGNVNGTKLYIEFIIDKNGNVKNAKIIKGINTSLDNEALRVVNAMPKWKPAQQNGKSVNSRYNLPIQLEIK